MSYNPETETLELEVLGSQDGANQTNLLVPGTGTDDVANNRSADNWWILKEMPLWYWPDSNRQR